MELIDCGMSTPNADCPPALNTTLFRMDKYYMLVRKFVNASFRLLIRKNWEESSLKEYNSILSSTGGPLWCVPFKAPHLTG